jgi:hypothetical protein
MYEPINQGSKVLSIILFFDGASFFKYQSIWAMFGIIADLKPIIRNSFENIISFFMFGSNKPNLNTFLDKHMSDFQNLIEKGVYIPNIGVFKLRIIGFIADSQAIPKVLNSKQYNGKFGCIHCNHEGLQKSKTLRVYPFDSSVTRRTNDQYSRELAEVLKEKKENHGIKGPFWIHKFIKIPDGVIIDYMHVSCIGTMEQQVTLWDLSKFIDQNPFYII